jgi:hypothetical protein
MKKVYVVALLIPVALASCAPSSDMDQVPINHIQVIGSHNSYKQAIAPGLFRLMEEKDSAAASKLDYSHISLPAQLDMGLRDLEIDVYADTSGGRFAHPRGLDWVGGQPPFDTAGLMNTPGFKVLHIPDIDFRSNCLTLRNCLIQLRTWSDAHPRHYPVYVTMNAKNQGLEKIVDSPGLTQPEHFDPAAFDRLDTTLLNNLGRSRLIIPDDVRGSYPTLDSAVLHGNWPKLSAARGRFIFILDQHDEERTAYINGHPSLKGRVLFADAEPGTPEAAIMIRNDPRQDTDITRLVKAGYIVRTRADDNTEEARRDDLSRFRAACRSGAQIITTDYYLKSTHFKSDYKVSFPGGKYVRTDPLFAH